MPSTYDDCEVQKETVRALLVWIPDLDEAKWIPKSVIHDDSEIYDDGEGSEGQLVVLTWFAEKEL